MNIEMQRSILILRSAIPVIVVLLLWPWTNCGAQVMPPASAPNEPCKTYTTNFPRAENPISEGGKWINGKADGLDWADVRTTPGFAYGLEVGGKRPSPQAYDDAGALLTGAWGPDQTAEGTVRAVNPNDTLNEEVELRLRSSFTTHKGTGYEILFRTSKDEKSYLDIARWNGPLGKFTYVIQGQGKKYGIASGDVVKATIFGNVITAYINGVQVLQGTDSTYTSGNPGMGFFLLGATSVNSDYGFTSFTATAGCAAQSLRK